MFNAEVEQWVSQYERVRRLNDPKVPASGQALMRMVWRVCNALEFDLSPLTSFGTVSPTASSARAAVTLLRYRR
jgi:hypothetical protein